MSAYSDLVAADGATAFWRLNQPSGTSATDSIGTRHGVISGPVTLGVAGHATGGLAMDFDAAGTGKILPVSLPPLGTAFTVECWVRPTAPATAQRNILFRAFAGDGDFQVYWLTFDQIRFFYYSGSGNTYPTGITPTVGTWLHLVVTGSGTTLTAYANGVAKTPMTVPAISGPGAGTPTIGNAADSGYTTSWVGQLADIAMYPTALSPAQILAHYNTGLLDETVPVPSAGCDHTTVWSKHLATLSAPTVESERAYLATLYGEPGGTDMSTLVSRYLQAITCGTAPATPAAPTLSLVSPNTGTQGTMVTVTLTGTNFVTGATGVSVNGVGISVVNIQVTSPTTLTADLAIDAAAPPTARSITVSTAGGSSSQAFTVATPAVLPTTNMTLHLDASVAAGNLFTTFVSGGPHTGSMADGGTVGVWASTVSGGLVAKQSGATALPLWRSATPLLPKPCVDFTGGQRVLVTTAVGGLVPLDTLVTASAYTMLFAFWAENVPVNPVFTQPYGGGPLIGDQGGGYFGAFLHLNGGVPSVTIFNYDGTSQYVTLPATVGAPHVFLARHQSGVLYGSLDGGAESSIASGTTSVLSNAGLIGAGTYGGGVLDGRIGEIAIWNVALTGTALQNAVAYFTSKWL